MNDARKMKDKAMNSLHKNKGRCPRLKMLVVSALLAVTMMVAATSVLASKGNLDTIQSAKKVKTPAPLSITLGKADIVSLPGNVSDVLVADPSVVDVQAVQADKLYIVGLNVGDTNIIALNAQGNVIRRIDIHVSYDLQAIQSLVESLFPDEKAKVSAIHDQILLTGRVSNPETASKIANLVGHYVSDLQDESGKEIDQLISNLMEVRGEQQVMLQVKIVEAERSIIKELGVDTRLNDPDELSVTSLFGASPPISYTGDLASRGGINAVQTAAGAGLTLAQDPMGLGGLFLDTGINGVGQLGVFLEALEEENLVNVLAEPNLTAVSGQQAGFLAGGEFPVPTGRDQFGNITIEFREFGVSLNFRPVVLSDKRINLQLNTEVSSLDNTNAVVLSDLVVPGLDIRRAETTIELPSGGSLMIAGLLQSETAKGMNGLPGIKNTPVLGDLISSDSFSRDETELVVIVTTYLVESYADKEKSEKVPREQNSQMAKIFAGNIRRMFNLDDEEVFAGQGAYGYMLD